MIPLAVDVAGRDVLVVGMGRVGAHKAHLLIDAGARVHVISDAVVATLPDGVASMRRRKYRSGDAVGYFLVVSATGDNEVNDLIVVDAARARTLLNVVDDPSRCSFYFTSVHRDGDVIVSISTSGASPSLAQWIRRRVQEFLPAGLGQVAAALRAERATLHARGESTELDWSGRVDVLVQNLAHGPREPS